MSDNIPFDVQMEIVKRVSSVKSVIQFRSVSKQWKSFIDSSDFINGYGARHTHPHSHILSYRSDALSKCYELKYICVLDDDIEPFKESLLVKCYEQVSAPFVVSPLMKKCWILRVIGSCHGLMCLLGYNEDKHCYMLVIWNPSIGKSIGIALGYDRQTLSETIFGFGVCPVTSDPTIVKLVCADNMPWHVEVFRLSTGVWNVIPSGNLPPQSQTIRLQTSTHVVIDELIYWCAWERTNYGENHMVVSFDLSTEEFKVVNLRDTLTNKLLSGVSICKLRGSLVVYGYIVAEEAVRGVWVMENNSSFRKLFTIVAPVYTPKMLGFKKTGDIIFQTGTMVDSFRAVLGVYDPCSQQIKELGISGVNGSFFMGSYQESLLLLHNVDSHIYYDTN